jgi:hypothetical protein
MMTNLDSRAAVRTTSALLLAVLLSGCTSQAIEVPGPAPREEPINSLALEQCLRVNGPETCGPTSE